MASKQGRLRSDIHYCYHCFDWVVGDDEWESHCESYLSSMTSKLRGTTTYCHTLVRPAYCSGCLGDIDLLPSQRMESWTRGHAQWTHTLNEHMKEYRWPHACPDPVCAREALSQNRPAPQFKDKEDLLFHFIDDHGYSRTVPRGLRHHMPHQSISQKDQASSAQDAFKKQRKRKWSERNDALKWMAPPDPEMMSKSERCASPARKRVREITSTISPTLLSTRRVDPLPIQPVSNKTVLSPADVLKDISLVDLTLESESESPDYQGISKGNAVGPIQDALRDDDVDMNALFSQHLRLPSPSPSVEQRSDYSGETLVAPVAESSRSGPLTKHALALESDNEMDRQDERRSNTEACHVRLRLSAPKPIRGLSNRRHPHKSPGSKPRLVLHVHHPVDDFPAKRRRRKK